MSQALTIYQKEALHFFRDQVEIRTLTSDCSFTEGPVWNKEGFYLFSDIAGNCIYRIVPGEEKELLIPESGTSDFSDPLIRPEQAGSNGLAYDSDGTLLVCRHGSHQVAKYIQGKLIPLVEQFEGKLFNSPNDIVVHKNGSIYFSDPPYVLKDTKLHPEKFQSKAGVYCYQQGRVKLVCDLYQYPNGLCFSPDGSRLYICSNKAFERFIAEYDVATNRFVKKFAGENGDGMKCDAHGNFYLCANEGLVILNNKGERLARIDLPAIPANMCFGGPEQKDLFITARENIFLIPDFLKRQ